jgi:arylsulfatase A-like enzyme
MENARRGLVGWILLMGLLPAGVGAQEAATGAPRNVVFILSDDHRYDMMGFHPGAPAWLETPNLDRMAREGAHLANAFVSTALCSPSRASILTGQYAHRHGVIDNGSPVPAGTRFFPEYLRQGGYRTGFFGKWHMGSATDAPRPGFDRWVSFRGQGVYHDPVLNVDGTRVERDGYIADILTDYALEWLEEQRTAGQPFFLYLSHKNVHAEFEPADRHQGRYAHVSPRYPATMYADAEGSESWPRWVREQRSSWHGVDYMYHGRMDFDEFYRRYAETLLSVDESVGRVLDYLERHGLAENTLVIYMGDNGFSFGEHGLIDKRHAFEESMRVPMLAWAPGFVAPGRVVEQNVMNTDLMPTLLELAKVERPADHAVDGRSFVPLLRGEAVAEWREDFLYEYYWERTFPQTPTQFALRTERYKYILTHGLWDEDMLFDLSADPEERYNLIDASEHQERVRDLYGRLFEALKATDGMQIPLRQMGIGQNDLRRPPGEPSTDPLVPAGTDPR